MSSPRKSLLPLLHPRYWLGWLILAKLRIAVLFPYRWQLFWGRVTGRLLYLVARRQRRFATINISLCFPQLSSGEQQALVVRSFESFGISLFELAMAWWWSDEKIAALVEVEGMQHLDRALEQSGGAILLGGHFTTLEIAGRFLRLSHPLTVTHRKDKNPLLAWALDRGRQPYYRVIQRDNVREIVRRLKAGDSVVFMPDGNFARKSLVFCDFMGVTAATNPATARFAKAAKVPVIPFVAIRKPEGAGYNLLLRPPLADFPSADLAADARHVNDEIGGLIRKAPEQYLWIQRRFDKRSEGEASLYW